MPDIADDAAREVTGMPLGRAGKQPARQRCQTDREPRRNDCIPNRLDSSRGTGFSPRLVFHASEARHNERAVGR